MSTEEAISVPNCTVCGQPAVAAFIQGQRGLAHCPNSDCEARARQMAGGDAVAWHFDEPWPASQGEAPAGGNLVGGAAEAAAGAAPPAGMVLDRMVDPRQAEHPRFARERRAPATELPVRPPLHQQPELISDAQKAKQAERTELREHAYLAFLEALEAFRAMHDDDGAAAVFDKLREAGELVDAVRAV